MRRLGLINFWALLGGSATVGVTPAALSPSKDPKSRMVPTGKGLEGRRTPKLYPPGKAGGRETSSQGSIKSYILSLLTTTEYSAVRKFLSSGRS